MINAVKAYCTCRTGHRWQ